MSGSFHLRPEQAVETDGSLRLGAALERPDGIRQQLWYRLPAALPPIQ